MSGVTGGFNLSQKLLCSQKGSMLEAMFSGRNPIHLNDQGEVEIDRDPIAFKYVINYLQNSDSQKVIYFEDEI